MPLVENTLFGEVDKVAVAIHRLKKYLSKTKGRGYFFADSGGKDSCVLRHILQRSGLPFDGHHNLTTVDPPEVIRFIKKEHPDTKIDKPEMSMFKWIQKKGPPMRNKRWCCEKLKERGGMGRVVAQGIRKAESAQRANRDVFEPDYFNTKEQMDSGTGKWFIHPILDFTNEDVWEYIRTYKVPYCKLYDEGFKRLGCVGCPNVRYQELEYARWPKIMNAYKRALIRFYEKRKAAGAESVKPWANGEEFFNWWLSRDGRASDTNQINFLEELEEK